MLISIKTRGLCSDLWLKCRVSICLFSNSLFKGEKNKMLKRVKSFIPWETWTGKLKRQALLFFSKLLNCLAIVTYERKTPWGVGVRTIVSLSTYGFANTPFTGKYHCRRFSAATIWQECTVLNPMRLRGQTGLKLLLRQRATGRTELHWGEKERQRKSHEFVKADLAHPGLSDRTAISLIVRVSDVPSISCDTVLGKNFSRKVPL